MVANPSEIVTVMNTNEPYELVKKHQLGAANSGVTFSCESYQGKKVS